MPSSLLTLAIETSCDETAAAVVRGDGLVLSSVLASQARQFSLVGGVVPEAAAREHVPQILPVIDEALREASVSWENIDQIAVTEGPGLIGSLIVGHAAAATLGFSREKSVVWVNHLRAHVLANWLYNAGEPKPEIALPALCLLVSGGHTELIWVESLVGEWRILGQTIDDAAGEAFDKVARLLGLAYPGGPEVSKRAALGDAATFDLPRPLLNQDNLNFSFSGLKSAVLREVEKYGEELKVESEKLKAKDGEDVMLSLSKHKSEQILRRAQDDNVDNRHPGQDPGSRGNTENETAQDSFINNLAASFEQAVVDVLVKKTARAVEQFAPASVLLAGGVAANVRLRATMAQTFGEKFYAPKLKFCTDNAAMVGVAGRRPASQLVC